MEGSAEEIQKQIENRIAELPADIQNVLLSSNFNQEILAIGGVYRLHVDQMQELSDLTMLVMLGFMNEDQYRKEITGLLAGNADTAGKVVTDVNSRIFLSIRESMKKFAAGQSTPAPVSEAPRVSISAPMPAPSALVPPPTPKPQVQTPPAAPLPVKSEPKLPDLTAVQTTLSQPTVATPPKVVAPPNPGPPKPQDYKADPYREPVN